jgi:hypothetical protein
MSRGSTVIKSVIIAAAMAIGLAAAHRVAAEDDSIRGDWVINEDLSDSFEETLKGLDRRRRGGFRDGGVGADRGPRGGGKGDDGSGGGDDGIAGHDAADKAFKGDASIRRARFESVRRIVSAQSLHIDGYGEIAITYDGEFTRNLVPNPNGRVFTASGRELVEDAFGHTLTYWDDHVLVVETTTQRGATMIERYEHNAEHAQLVISVSITPPGRKGIELVRVFDRNETL